MANTFPVNQSSVAKLHLALTGYRQFKEQQLMRMMFITFTIFAYLWNCITQLKLTCISFDAAFSECAENGLGNVRTVNRNSEYLDKISKLFNLISLNNFDKTTLTEKKVNEEKIPVRSFALNQYFVVWQLSFLNTRGQ